ncbi:MAG: hypothetical protein KKF16_05060 [Euryarchaeota archaeon]|nr:hypothetical protein [Euryarchaeota archaeon]
MNKKRMFGTYSPPAQNQNCIDTAHVPLAPDPMTGADNFFKGNVKKIGSAIAR